MRKGFTLIELLAVIVILTIIAFISVPLILNVIDNAKKGAFKSTAYGIIEAAEFEFSQNLLKGNTEEVIFTYIDGVELPNIYK
jgi:prepilin-type N-terminal cleavage/methylation domain-containing protein